MARAQHTHDHQWSGPRLPPVCRASPGCQSNAPSRCCRAGEVRGVAHTMMHTHDVQALALEGDEGSGGSADADGAIGRVCAHRAVHGVVGQGGALSGAVSTRSC